MEAETAQTSFLASRRGQLTLALLCAVAFLDFVNASIVNIALPSIRRALHFSVGDLQWVPSGYRRGGPLRQIREARPGDAEGIADVHVRAWQVAYLGLLTEEVIRAHACQRRQWWSSYLEQAQPRQYVLVAVAGDRIAGFATARQSPDEDAEPDQAEVSGLYVAPEAWEQGIGEALLEALLDQLQGDRFKTATLCVLAGTTARAASTRIAAGTSRGPNACTPTEERRNCATKSG
jgi:L-amino acid N-acyltransferase YncA